MVADIFYDYGSPQERLATKEEFRSILDDITHEFEKDNGKVQYKHTVRIEVLVHQSKYELSSICIHYRYRWKKVAPSLSVQQTK